MEQSISESTKNNPKRFWKYVNQKTKLKSPVASLYRTKDKDKDDLVDNDFGKAETLANHFTSVFSKSLSMSGIYQNIHILQMINKLFFLLN